jgi:hypothetical protein
MGSSSLRWLNQSTHSSVANSTASNDRHGPRRWMISGPEKEALQQAEAVAGEDPAVKKQN